MAGEDPFDTPEWREYAQHAKDELVPMIQQSAITMQLWDGKADPKIAMELGYSILLDKPILVMVAEGTEVPDKLAQIADEIIVYERDNMPAKASEIAAAITRVTGRQVGE